MLIILLSILLVACSSAEEKSKESPSELKQEDSKQEKSQPNEEETDKEVPKVQASLECEGILLESDVVIEGKKLGDCMVAAILAAGTGTHRVESTGEPATVVDFQWNSDFSMNVKEGPIKMEMVTMTDVGLWLTNDYLGADHGAKKWRFLNRMVSPIESMKNVNLA
ncbi:hypothetical protein [Bacillus sp. REN10]|uniref:hypothetical protein n=1 Tax=Bacillus sp. REN10 TaxID=2782541 RepID=UPI00193BF9F7|nr:hypothetical protein [Bacillus sp. REN10]